MSHHQAPIFFFDTRNRETDGPQPDIREGVDRHDGRGLGEAVALQHRHARRVEELLRHRPKAAHRRR